MSKLGVSVQDFHCMHVKAHVWSHNRIASIVHTNDVSLVRAAQGSKAGRVQVRVSTYQRDRSHQQPRWVRLHTHGVRQCCSSVHTRMQSAAHRGLQGYRQTAEPISQHRL